MKHAVIFAALIQAAALANANPTIERDGVMTSRDGRSLYTFDKDGSGKSNCAGACLAAWPAFRVANPQLAGNGFSIIVRDDGIEQWAMDGKPLYFFAGDAKAGDINGDNQGGVWHVVRTAQKTPSTPQKSSSYPANSGYASSYNYGN